MVKAIILAGSIFLLSGYSFAQEGGGGGGGGGGSVGPQFPDIDQGRQFEEMDEIDRKLNDLKRESTKARPKFAALFDQAQQAILKDDLKKAEQLKGKLHEFSNLNNYEESRLYLIDYWYYGKTGNKDAENEAASKLVAVGAGHIDSHAIVDAGMRLLKRQYNNQDIGGAIETLNNLRKEPDSQAELMSIIQVVQKLDAIAEQQTDFVQKITVNETGAWSTKLFKPQFYFNNITGEISTLGFNCANKQTTLNYKADSVMEIPEAWGSCTMKINAKPNTTFNLVQAQKKSA